MPRSKTPHLLTTRQRVVLKHLLSGGSKQCIARKLGISVHTVHVHVKSIYRRYRVHSRPQLMSKVLVPR